MTTKHKYHVAIVIPESQQDAANEAAAALTGRPEDLATFRASRSLLDAAGERYLVAGPTPMTQRHLDNLPMLSGEFEVDARWAVIREWVGNEAVTVLPFEEWLESEGLTVETPLIYRMNTDTAEGLQELDGVGPTLAQRIIDGRPYFTESDLVEVQGISQAMIDGWTE